MRTWQGPIVMWVLVVAMSGCGSERVLLAGVKGRVSDDDGAKPPNAFPTASFVVTPESGTTQTVFQFDASGSSDVEDSVSALQVRWDWESDGTWDSDYSTTKTATHQYGTTGTKTIKLALKDTGGLTETTMRLVTVTGPTWNIAGDWSLASNPNGAWSYGRQWTLGGEFILFPCTLDGTFWLPCDSYDPSMQAGIDVWANDNSNGIPAIRWTCPETGMYDLTCTFRGADWRGVDVLVYVAVNDSIWFADHIEADGDSATFSLDRCPLASGEYMDFLVASAGGIVCSDACWTLVTGVISAVLPIPAASRTEPAR